MCGQLDSPTRGKMRAMRMVGDCVRQNARPLAAAFHTGHAGVLPMCSALPPQLSPAKTPPKGQEWPASLL
jgi:hypothetical protein